MKLSEIKDSRLYSVELRCIENNCNGLVFWHSKYSHRKCEKCGAVDGEWIGIPDSWVPLPPDLQRYEDAIESLLR